MPQERKKTSLERIRLFGLFILLPFFIVQFTELAFLSFELVLVPNFENHIAKFLSASVEVSSKFCLMGLPFALSYIFIQRFDRNERSIQKALLCIESAISIVLCSLILLVVLLTKATDFGNTGNMISFYKITNQVACFRNVLPRLTSEWNDKLASRLVDPSLANQFFITAYEDAVHANLNNGALASILIRTIQSSLHSAQYENAEAFCKEFLGRSGISEDYKIQANNLLAKALYEQNKYSDSLEILEKNIPACRSTKNSTELALAEIMKGKCLDADERFDQSEPLYEDAIANVKDDAITTALYQCYFARHYASARDWRKADEQIAKAKQIAWGLKESQKELFCGVLTNSALMDSENGRIDEALKNLEDAHNVHPCGNERLAFASILDRQHKYGSSDQIYATNENNSDFTAQISYSRLKILLSRLTPQCIVYLKNRWKTDGYGEYSHGIFKQRALTEIPFPGTVVNFTLPRRYLLTFNLKPDFIDLSKGESDRVLVDNNSVELCITKVGPKAQIKFPWCTKISKSESTCNSELVGAKYGPTSISELIRPTFLELPKEDWQNLRKEAGASTQTLAHFRESQKVLPSVKHLLIDPKYKDAANDSFVFNLKAQL